MNPIKVLYVYGDTLRLGGIERYMMNNFRYMDRNVVQVDFALMSNEASVFDEEILSAGAKIYHLPKPGSHPLMFRRAIGKILRSGEYRVVHAHCDAMNLRIMQIAKHYQIPVRIAHSHNTEHILSSKWKFRYYEFCRNFVGAFATERWACSHAAGKWMFGAYPYRMVPNAIMLDQFAFDAEKRKQMRARFNIGEDEVVLGHVGRFHKQKNHTFLIDLMKLLKDSDRKYRLLMVGSGDLQESIQELALMSGQKERFIFSGPVKNPEDFYQMMDLFLLPSLFEGYPLVATEAEANGLPCIISDRVTREVNISDMVRFCPLETKQWAQAVKEFGKPQRRDVTEALKQAGMDVIISAKRTENEYVRLYKNAEKR